MGFVLGLSGPALAGKDTVADLLIQKHGWTGKLSFARNLKNMCKAVFSLSEIDVETQEGKKRLFSSPVIFNNSHLDSITYWVSLTHSDYPISYEATEKVKFFIGTEFKTPREILQLVGTEICRTLIPTYHVDIVFRDAKAKGHWIVTDVRFPNEGDIILDELKGKVISIDRVVDNKGVVNMSHPSETAMKHWGRFNDTLDNSKDGLDFLSKEVDDFLERNNLKCLVAQ